MFQSPQVLQLGSLFYQQGVPAKFSAPRLLAFNRELARELQFSMSDADEGDLAAIFSGQVRSLNQPLLAMVYAGHQFGHFNPQLGDGRALLIGELKDSTGRAFEIQLKGSGPTPFSRRGDGLSALGPVIREYLVSEAMHCLGVPTTRALAAVSTGDFVIRESRLPGGVFTRVARSHLRIGTFEYFAAKRDLHSLNLLLNYAIQRLYPDVDEIAEGPLRSLAFFKRVGEAQAKLVAQWMAIGFIHGVMNTDNVSISGETIDFGPCAFMDEFQFNQVFSFIDEQGRYAYWNQPAILHWNLGRLADCLLIMADPKEQEALQKRLEAELNQIMSVFESHWLTLMGRKLGIEMAGTQDLDLIRNWLQLINKYQADFTQSHRAIGLDIIQTMDPRAVDASMQSHRLDAKFFDLLPETLKGSEEFKNIKQQLTDRLEQQALSVPKVRSIMEESNPIYIPRNHLVEKAIQGALQGDLSFFFEFESVLKHPYQAQPEKDLFAEGPKPEERIGNTFCGT